MEEKVMSLEKNLIEENELISEIRANRDGLKNMLNEINELKSKINDILPKDKDFRNRHLIDEKVKIISSVVELELKVRDKIDSSVKNEFEIRRKIREDEKSDSDEITLDEIARIAKAIELRNKQENRGGEECHQD